LIILISIGLCVVLCTIIGLSAVFRQKIDPNFSNSTNVLLSKRAEAYGKIKEQTKENLSKSKQSRANLMTEQEIAVMDKYETAFFEGFFDLLDDNADISQIEDYTKDFFSDAKKQDLFDILENLANKSQELNIADILRGSKFIGTYSPSDRRGIDYLQGQMVTYGILTGCFVVLAIAAAIVVAIATVATFGLTAALGSILVGICSAMSGIMWGVAASATNCMEDAAWYASQGRTYSIYKNTGFLGIVTGFSVRL